jgi:hypothetical protein
MFIMVQLAPARVFCMRNALAVSRSIFQVAPRRRGLASAAVDDGLLPLKGIRVLDMTRVLAGVSSLYVE